MSIVIKFFPCTRSMPPLRAFHPEAMQDLLPQSRAPGLQDRKAVTAWSDSYYSDNRYSDNTTLGLYLVSVRLSEGRVRPSGSLSPGKFCRSQIVVCEFQRISDEINVTLIYIFRTQNMLKYNAFITIQIHLSRKFHFIWPKLAAP